MNTKPKSKKKIILLIVCICIAVPVIFGTVWFKGYYDERYVISDYYYTVVPLDYDNTPIDAVDDSGKKQDLKVVYNLKCYDENGTEKDIEFNALLSSQDVYPPGTYIKIGMSKTYVRDKVAIPESEIPAKARGEIRENFAPSSAASLTAYAAERTTQLSARNTSTLNISCEAKDDTLMYSYVYSSSAVEEAKKSAEYLNAAFKSQFRTDKEARPELKAIILEIKLDDNTVISSEKFDILVKFGYEME